MVADKLYEIGENLGLNKKDVEDILSIRPVNKDNVESASPLEVYKAIGRYGTISIKDFQGQRSVMYMFPNKLYKIGRNLGLNKIDIDSVLSITPSDEGDIKSTSPVEIYKEFGKYGTVSIHDFSRQQETLDTIPNKLYELGQCLGLDKKDIDNVYSPLATKKDDASVASPLEVYKDSSHYGTISIKDFY